MSAQRYTTPIALRRMSEGNCPECGNPESAHGGLGGPNCGLTDNGVAQRIHQFNEDMKPLAECVNPKCPEAGQCRGQCLSKF